MSTKDIWYGVLEAGDKSSPVVRDTTIDAGQNRIYLYNYNRNQFIEYAQAIVEPKLRELFEGDISREELDKAFKAAYKSFTSARKTNTLGSTIPATPPEKDEDIDISDDDDEFIDDE